MKKSEDVALDQTESLCKKIPQSVRKFIFILILILFLIGTIFLFHYLSRKGIPKFLIFFIYSFIATIFPQQKIEADINSIRNFHHQQPGNCYYFQFKSINLFEGCGMFLENINYTVRRESDDAIRIIIPALPVELEICYSCNFHVACQYLSVESSKRTNVEFNPVIIQLNNTMKIPLQLPPPIPKKEELKATIISEIPRPPQHNDNPAPGIFILIAAVITAMLLSFLFFVVVVIFFCSLMFCSSFLCAACCCSICIKRGQ